MSEVEKARWGVGLYLGDVFFEDILDACLLGLFLDTLAYINIETSQDNRSPIDLQRGGGYNSRTGKGRGGEGVNEVLV